MATGGFWRFRGRSAGAGAAGGPAEPERRAGRGLTDAHVLADPPIEGQLGLEVRVLAVAVAELLLLEHPDEHLDAARPALRRGASRRRGAAPRSPRTS